MNHRLIVGAFVVGLIGGCSFQNRFEQYCDVSRACTCTNGTCCVKEGKECSFEAPCCAGFTCNSGNVCQQTSGFGGGTGGGTGGGGGALQLVLIDAGSIYEPGVKMRLPDGGYLEFCADGGIVPTWIHADGGVTTGACCGAFLDTCTDGTNTCTMPGSPSQPGRPCCYCDQDCPENEASMVCPYQAPLAIDVLVAPLRISDLPPSAFCADGGLKVLGGCCQPNPGMTSCDFSGVSCTLEAQSGGPCCLVALGNYTPPLLSNDCRVNGACDCNTTGGCFNNPGAICVDLVP